MGKEPSVFGIGLSRIGTTGLSHRLDLLGVKAVHYPCGGGIYAE